MSINPIWEKFQRATVTLARSGTIKDRLTDAYRAHLVDVNDEELPRDLREKFRAFRRAMTREQPMLRGEDAFRATVRKMSCDDAEDLACSVVHIFGSLPRSCASGARTKPSAQVVPLFIAEA
jgi:hypothetical protein